MRSSLKTFAIALLGLAHPAAAQKQPPLPIGEWGHDFRGTPNCVRPFLKIEIGRIIERLDEGDGRCKVTSLRRKGQALHGAYACEWDASVPQGLRERPDDDGSGFSLVVKSPTRILYNNALFGLCPAPSEAVR